MELILPFPVQAQGVEPIVPGQEKILSVILTEGESPELEIQTRYTPACFRRASPSRTPQII